MKSATPAPEHRRLLPAGVLLVTGIVILHAAAAAGQEAPQRMAWSIGIGQTLIDEKGDQAAFRERADKYEGLALRGIAFHALAPYGLRIDLDAPRLDPIAHDARLDVSSRMLSGSLRSARNHFFFDPAGDLRSHRDQLTGDLRCRPVKHVELFGEYARIDLKGDRRDLVALDEGGLGPTYDQRTGTWRGGVRLDGLRSTASVSYLGRTFNSAAVPLYDRGVHGVEAQLRSQILPVMTAEGLYGWARTTLSHTGTKLDSNRFSGRLDFRLGRGFTAGPTGRIEDSSDHALFVHSTIWAMGLGVRGAFKRGWCDIEGEGGQRESNIGTSKVRGLRAAGGYTVGGGFTLQGHYGREARHRRDLDSDPSYRPPLPNLVGTLMAQRVEGRLKWRWNSRWSAEGLVARLDKDYDDVQVDQRVWRYGVQGSCLAARGLRCDAGWRLDDTGETRPASGYDLRTNILYAGADLSSLPRLSLRGRFDYYRMQRDLDEWKMLVTAGAELDVGHDLFLGVAYERDGFGESFDAGDYRANVWEITVRHAFGM